MVLEQHKGLLSITTISTTSTTTITTTAISSTTLLSPPGTPLSVVSLQGTTLLNSGMSQINTNITTIREEKFPVIQSTSSTSICSNSRMPQPSKSSTTIPATVPSSSFSSLDGIFNEII